MGEDGRLESEVDGEWVGGEKMGQAGGWREGVCRGDLVR